MKCGSKYLYLKRKDLWSNFFAFIPVKCKSWSCPTCRVTKSRVVAEYIQKQFTDTTNYMMSITFFHSGSPLDAWNNIGKNWNLMRTYIAKKYGKFDYIRIVEPHKKGGWPHIHVLTKGNVIDKDIVKKVTGWGFGWNFHVKQISGDDASKYLSKYLSKEWPSIDGDIFRVASKTRIVTCSRGMPPIFTTKSEWEVIRYDIPSKATHFLCNKLIDVLHKNNASYINVKPAAGGFIIESSIAIQDSWLENISEKYTWKYVENDEYDYIPFGEQLHLLI